MTEIGIKVKLYTVSQILPSALPLDPKPSPTVHHGQLCTRHLAEGASEPEIQLGLHAPAMCPGVDSAQSEVHLFLILQKVPSDH